MYSLTNCPESSHPKTSRKNVFDPINSAVSVLHARISMVFDYTDRLLCK